MDWMNEVEQVLQQYRGASPTPPQDPRKDFAQVAQSAPASVISDGLAGAFRSPGTPPFSHMLAQLFGQSNGNQQAGILNHLLEAAGPAGLSGGMLSQLAGYLSGGRANVTPQQAQQVPPQAVQQLAEQAQRNDPSIVDKASAFYAQHPALVQGLGAATLAVLMSHLSQRH